MKRAVLWVFAMIVIGSCCFASALHEETPALVAALSAQLKEKGISKVSVLDFTDIQRRPTELGRYVADELAVDIGQTPGLTLIERGRISVIMEEHQLTTEGLVHPENAKKLGQFAGVEAILIGSLAAMDGQVTLTVRAISTETAAVVATGRTSFELTRDMQRMLGMSLAGGTTSGAAVAPSAAAQQGYASATAEEGGVLLVREFGPLSVELRSVSRTSTRNTAGAMVPAISCSFDFVNRETRGPIAAAANSDLSQKGAHMTAGSGKRYHNRENPVVSGPRAILMDSKHGLWVLAPAGLRGLAGVFCFESSDERSSGWRVSQNNAPAIVEYIRTGNRFDFSKAPEFGKNWSGDFTRIPPGERARVTVVFIPEHLAKASSYQEDRQKFAWPDSFQVDLEFVFAVLMGDQPVEQAKDIFLRNLTVDRIVLPQ